MIEKVKNDYQKGKSGRDIAKELGVSHQTVYNLIAKHGLTNGRRKPTAFELSEHSIKELEKITGFSKTSLYRYKNEIQNC